MRFEVRGEKNSVRLEVGDNKIGVRLEVRGKSKGTQHTIQEGNYDVASNLKRSGPLT